MMFVDALSPNRHANFVVIVMTIYTYIYVNIYTYIHTIVVVHIRLERGQEVGNPLSFCYGHFHIKTTTLYALLPNHPIYINPMWLSAMIMHLR